jgi:hypothetical protein
MIQTFSGVSQLLEKLRPLCTYLRSLQPEAARLHIHFRPSLVSQVPPTLFLCLSFCLKGLSHEMDLAFDVCMVSSRPK